MAAVETLLRQTGDLGFRPENEPTGLFSAPLDDAIRRLQRRNGLVDDGIANPDGETIRALEDESFAGDDGERRRRQADCIQNRGQLESLQIRLDKATEAVEEASAGVERLSEDAERLFEMADAQDLLNTIFSFARAFNPLQKGVSLARALRQLARDLVEGETVGTIGRQQAEGAAGVLEDAVEEFEFRLQELQRRQDERRDLLQARGAGLRLSFGRREPKADLEDLVLSPFQRHRLLVDVQP